MNENLNIEQVIDQFYKNNERFKNLKKVVEDDKKSIKEYMLSNNKFTIEAETAQAKIVEIEKNSYKENEFIEFLQTFEIPGLIEYKPTINMDALEDSIHHGYINPKEISPYIIKDTTYRLDVKKLKK